MECEGSASACLNEFSFPVEIITEILLRLPVKSLLKFRCVCKFWLSLISSREFIKIHLRLSANKEETLHMLFSEELDFGDRWIFKEFPVASLFYDSVAHAVDLDYPIENDTQQLFVEGSCDGLVLISDGEIDFSLLWNPTIRKHKTLPPFMPRWKRYIATYGFGFDELHDDYKVVGIFYNFINDFVDDVEVKVYSLKKDSWATVDYCRETLLIKSVVDNNWDTLGYVPGLFVGGVLHWHTGRNIVSFDLANEKWDKMEKPSYEVGEYEMFLGFLGSDLCVFTDCNKTHLGVWVMKEYWVKESWIKLLTIKYQNCQNGFHPPLFRSNDGEMLFLVYSKFRIYNSKDNSFRYPTLTNHGGNHDTEIYIESLVCPFSTEGTENPAEERQKKLKIKTIE